jgi:HPt (histidine-containing phosphotransfer) domain-containing protein
MTNIIDPTAFANLKSMAGADFLPELIATFLDDAPQLIRQLHDALDANDAESFRRAAHSLKSNAATFGALELSGLARELEMIGRENKLGEGRARLGSLEEAYASAAQALKEMSA